MANEEVGITFGDTVVIPGNGGYMQTNAASNTLATWHRSDWANFSFTNDYSRISDAGISAANRANLPQFTLYQNGALVCEYISSTQPDPSSGAEPCSASACNGGYASSGGFYGAVRQLPKASLAPTISYLRGRALLAYPNPSSDQLFVDVSVDNPLTYRLVLMSINGEMVLSRAIGDLGVQGKTLINVRELPSGIYLLSLLAGSDYGFKSIATEKIAIVH